MMIFELDEEQVKKLNKFILECYEKDLEGQKADKNFKRDIAVQMAWDSGFPYHGAIGGAFTYCFTPNSIGETKIVQFTGTHYKAEIDLTDYESW